MEAEHDFNACLILHYSLLFVRNLLCFIFLSPQDIFRITFGQVIFLVNYGVYNVTMPVCFTICSSMIPESITQIKRTVRKYPSCSNNSHLISKQNLFYLNRIENEDIVYISVCGMFNLTRSYILSAFPLVLIYGLLIINLNL